jgi:hypothetical protein
MAARPHGVPRLSEAPPLTSLFHAGGELASSLLGMTPFVRGAPQPQREQLEAEDELAVTQLVGNRPDGDDETHYYPDLVGLTL